MRTRIQALAERVRQLYYAVVLGGYGCPSCAGPLAMQAEGRCVCQQCGRAFDPTVAFQRCPDCEGRLQRRICRYVCRGCGRDVASRFCFDRQEFDAAYFRRKMAESRQRKAATKRRRREQSWQPSSSELLPGPADLDAAPGLAAALDALTGAADPQLIQRWREQFDLNAYERHLLAHVGTDPVPLEAVPPLTGRGRIDRIWLFVAAVFLAHAGAIAIRQEGTTIEVYARETHRKGQAVPPDAPEADGRRGALGGAEA
ncbi:MAG: hypothetical protein ACOC93_00065 [Planctomycetota bacterium]